MQALLLSQAADGAVTSEITEVDPALLPAGDVLVRVAHSTVNYKDGLILKGLGCLVRTYPHVPGVDFAGTVVESSHPGITVGQSVILTGWRVGESRWGGYAELARVPGEYLVPLPPGLTLAQSMAIGTAGLSAMLAILALEDHGLTPEKGEVLVTGATGGVGSVAVAVLAALGYSVAAVTGKASAHEYLTDLGATTSIDRATLEAPGKALEGERWAGVIDAVGGPILARALSQMKYNGSVAAVGLAASAKLETTVTPFLLRGVNLLGIDSVMCPIPRRRLAWVRLAAGLPLDKLAAMIIPATLDDLPRLADDIIAGQVRGRVVVTL